MDKNIKQLKQEYLRQAFCLEKNIELMEHQLEELQELSRGVSMPGNQQGGSGIRSSESPQILLRLKCMELEEEINKEKLKMISQKKEIINAINRVPDYFQQFALKLRFVEGKRLNDVATLIGFSTRQTSRIINDGLKMIALPNNAKQK